MEGRMESGPLGGASVGTQPQAPRSCCWSCDSQETGHQTARETEEGGHTGSTQRCQGWGAPAFGAPGVRHTWLLLSRGPLIPRSLRPEAHDLPQ